MRIKKDGVEFVDCVDRTNYTIRELTRAAMKDVARFLRKRAVVKFKTLPGLRRSRRVYNSVQYWVRKQECDLQIGIKHGTWYGVEEELGSERMAKKGFLYETVAENIDTIRDIEGQYLSAIEDEQRALALIDESEEVGDGYKD